MKIVHCVDYYQPKLGYQEVYLAQEQAKLGHEVHIITSDRNFPFPFYQETYTLNLGARQMNSGLSKINGVHIHRLKAWFEYPSSAYIILRGLKKKLEDLQPDLVTCHGIIGFNAWQCARNKPKLNYKLYFDNHSCHQNSNLNNHWLKRLYVKFYKLFLKPTIRHNGQRFIGIAPDEEQFIKDLLDITYTEQIFLGADTNIFKPDKEKRQLTRQKLGIENQDIVLVSAGKINPDKKTDWLVKSFLAVRKNTPHLKLLLIGRSPQYFLKKLKNLDTENCIIWQNFVPAKELPQFFQASDLGIWAGTCSNAIQEALACGLPLILSNIKSNHLLIKNLSTNMKGENGLIINNQAELLNSIQYLVNHSSNLKSMGKISREYALEYFAWTKIAEKFL